MVCVSLFYEERVETMSVILQNGLLKRDAFMFGEYQLLQPTLNILIVNLMPNRLQTEKQFIGLLMKLSVNVRLTFAVPATHQIKHETEQIVQNYVTLADIWDRHFDGLIVTGAPVDRTKFEKIDYWQEFERLLAWRKTHVKESLFACWAVYGAGYAERNFPVRHITSKISGVYRTNDILNRRSTLTTGLNHITMPHSRYFTIPNQGLPRRLKVAGDNKLGAFVLRDELLHSTYVTGHLEYDTETLAEEYQRDLAKGIVTREPENYLVDGQPRNNWAADADKFFVNWGKMLLASTKNSSVINLIPALN